jgi:hypothetical protein
MEKMTITDDNVGYGRRGSGRIHLGGLIMTTATVLDPAAELERMLERHDGVEPIVTIAKDMALVSYRHDGRLHTDIWLYSDRGWRMHGTHSVTG